MKAPLPYRSSSPLPRFLWGDSLLDFPWNDLLDHRDRLEAVEFLAHTQSPRFICRIVDNRHWNVVPEEGEIRVGREEEEDRTVWKTNFGFYATDFVFFDPTPNDKTMEHILREACVDRQLRDVFFGVIK
jgi:hypothetical protein